MRTKPILAEYTIHDFFGLWYTTYGNDDFAAIKLAAIELAGRNGCIKKDGNDLACFSAIDGRTMIELA